jgi:hypothetical protein
MGLGDLSRRPRGGPPPVGPLVRSNARDPKWCGLGRQRRGIDDIGDREPAARLQHAERLAVHLRLVSAAARCKLTATLKEPGSVEWLVAQSEGVRRSMSMKKELNRSTPTRPKQSAQEKAATSSFTASAYWKFESTPLQRGVSNEPFLKRPAIGPAMARELFDAASLSVI